jgi:hypothetical protein
MSGIGNLVSSVTVKVTPAGGQRVSRPVTRHDFDKKLDKVCSFIQGGVFAKISAESGLIPQDMRNFVEHIGLCIRILSQKARALSHPEQPGWLHKLRALF